ncbi:MAG: aldo/keto reductase [Propioniciclava sp.]
METVTLPGGGTMPVLGFGTYKIPSADTQRAVETALEVGYRHLDTATMYRNEAGVGRAIAGAGLPRTDLFVTTKLDNIPRTPASVRSAFDASLDALGLDAIDLYLIHWPMARSTDIVATWESVLALRDTGRVAEVGVSNFTLAHLYRIIDATGVVPAVNQVEINPYLTQEPLRAAHARWGITTQAWSPLARGRVIGDPAVAAVAERIGATRSQVVLAWHRQRGDVVMPKSVRRERMVENLAADQVVLDDAAMATLSGLNADEHSGSDPDQVELGTRRSGA